MSFRSANRFSLNTTKSNVFNRLSLEQNSDSIENLFITCQSTFLTLWQFTVNSSSPSIKINEKHVPINCLPLITLNLGFEILNACFSPDNSLVVATGGSPLVFVWHLSPDILKIPHQNTPANTEAYLSSQNHYQKYRPHPLLDIARMKEYPYLTYKFWNFKQLIRSQPDQPLLPPTPQLNFTRFIQKGRGFILLVGGSGLKAVYQLDLSLNKLLASVSPGKNREIVSVGLNCNNSLVGIITNENSLILIYRDLGTRHIIPLLNKSNIPADLPSTLSFSGFETHQFMVGYRSGAIAIFDCLHWLKGSGTPSNSLLPIAHFPSTKIWPNSSPVKPVFTQFNRFLIAKPCVDGKIIITDINELKTAKQIIVDNTPSSVKFGVTGAHVMVGYERGGIELFDIRAIEKPVWQIHPDSNLVVDPVRVIEFQNHLTRSKVFDTSAHTLRTKDTGSKVSSHAFQSLPKPPSIIGKRRSRANSPDNTRNERILNNRFDFASKNHDSLKAQDRDLHPDSVDLSSQQNSFMAEPSFIDVFSPVKKSQKYNVMEVSRVRPVTQKSPGPSHTKFFGTSGHLTHSNSKSEVVYIDLCDQELDHKSSSSIPKTKKLPGQADSALFQLKQLNNTTDTAISMTEPLTNGFTPSATSELTRNHNNVMEPGISPHLLCNSNGSLNFMKTYSQPSRTNFALKKSPQPMDFDGNIEELSEKVSPLKTKDLCNPLKSPLQKSKIVHNFNFLIKPDKPDSTYREPSPKPILNKKVPGHSVLSTLPKSPRDTNTSSVSVNSDKTAPFNPKTLSNHKSDSVFDLSNISSRSTKYPSTSNTQTKASNYNGNSTLLEKNEVDSENGNNVLVNLVREVVHDANRSLRVGLKEDIHSVHLELIAQMQTLKQEMKEMQDLSSRVPDLLQRIQTLEEENRRLKLDY